MAKRFVQTACSASTETRGHKGMQMSKVLSFIYDIHIGAPAGKVWKGLIDGEITRHYVYGTRFESKLKKGGRYAYMGDGDFKVVEGEIIDIEAEKRLVMSWKANYDESVAKDEPSRVTFELTASGPATTKLHLVHDSFKDNSATYVGSVEGWPLMLSSLKSLLETGRALEAK
jgi:uncharacterized protein YndB with AHSA1/START domain